MRQNYVFIIVLIICFSAELSWGNEAPLTLVQALEIAQQHNPRMIEAQQAIVAAKGGKITSASLPNPEIELELGGLKKNEQGKRDTNVDSITLKQRFDPIGVGHLKGKIARNHVLAQEQLLRSTWSDVYVHVRETYSKIILNKKELELQRSNLKAMRQFFSNVQISYEGGQIFKNQFQRAKVELLKTESDYLQAENALNIEKARLNLLLGRLRTTVFEINEDLKEELLEFDLEQLSQRALGENPDLKKERIELDSKHKNVQKEQLGRLPSYSLGFQKTDKSYEKDYAVLFGISFPLWNLNSGEVRKAQAERDAQKTKVQAFEQEIDFEVYRLYQESQLARKQLTLHKKSLQEANDMFRLAGLRYRDGHIGFMEYLDQVKTSMEARIQYYRGLYALSQTISALEKAVHGSLRGEEFFK